MSCPRMLVYSPQDAFLFEINPNDVFAASMREAINGEHSLRLVTTKVLEKEQRVLFKDTANKWREYVITGTDRQHQGHQKPFGEYQAVWSLQHDFKLFGVDDLPGIEEPVMASDALRAILSGTSRWVRGTITLLNTGGAEMIQRNGWEALSILVENWGGEIDATIEVGTHGVTARKIDLYEAQGRQKALRRFDYSRDMESISRHVDEMPVACRIRPYGKSEKDVDGFNVALTIEEVTPNGEDYIQNDDVVDLLKLPDGNGGWEYPTTNVTNSQIDDPELLLEWAEEVLDEYTLPKVTYSASVNQFTAAGLDAHGVELGDAVQCVDRAFSDEGLRLELRINELDVDLLNPKLTTITLGDSHTSYVVSVSGTISSMKSEIENTSAMAQSSADYLDNLLYNLNQEINANGGYTYITAGQGMRTYDVAVSDPLVGAEANRVTEVKGGTIRIAEKDAQNQWEWRTVFTNGHIAADVVTAVNITAGYIGNVQGGTYWDLDNGIFRIGGPSYLGNRTVEEVLSDVDATVSEVVVEYAENQDNQNPPGIGWSPVAPTWKSGWYIWQRTKTTKADGGITYSDATCISGREGQDGTSVTILGSYDTLEELQEAHPTGSEGDGYIVGTDLYVWNGTEWLNVGQIQGPAGNNGTSVVISSTSVQYAKSTSGTTPPSSGWQSTPVSTSEKEYLWSKTYVMYSDGTDTTTYGVAGHGTNGTSVTVSKIEYGTSSSASTSPSSWSMTAPTSLAKGTWLWVKTTYSNSSTATTKSYVGMDGDDGKSVAIQSATKSGDVTTVVLAETDPSTGTTTTKTLTITDGTDGTNGTNGLYGYVHTAWANSADGKTDFSTTESANKSYLGVYSDNTEADSTAYTSYSWSLIKGAKGDIGEQGPKGDPGAAARSYAIIVSPDTLKRYVETSEETAILSPSSIVVSSVYSVGAEAPAIYMGRYVIEEYDGSTWSTKYTSSSNESSHTYQPTDDAQMIRCTLYLAGGTTTRLDSQTVPILSDGIDGSKGDAGDEGQPAYSVWLTNDSHTFPASSTAALDGSANTYVMVYKGTSPVRPVSIGTVSVPTGMTATKLNNGSATKDAGLTFKVTSSLTQRSGTIDIPITADGRSFTVTFSWALALSGDDGVGIASITSLYYLSTSEQTPTDGSWEEDQPTWESGRYIWTKSHIVWDDGREEDTDPILANALTQSTELASNAMDRATSAQTNLDGEIEERQSNFNSLSGIVDIIQSNMSDMETDLKADINDAKRYATDYIEYNQSTGELTLGTTGNDIKNVMTSSQIEFRAPTGTITYWGVNSDGIGTMYIETAQVGNYLKFGNFAWIARDNGNMTLKYLG